MPTQFDINNGSPCAVFINGEVIYGVAVNIGNRFARVYSKQGGSSKSDILEDFAINSNKCRIIFG